MVTTHDDTRDAADLALRYPRLLWSAGGFRRLQTTGLQTRPIEQWRPPRIIAQVNRWGLAWLRERAAERRGQQTWRTLRQTLDHVTVARDRMHGKTMRPSPQVTSPMAAILRRRGLPRPQKMLDVSDSAHAPS